MFNIFNKLHFRTKTQKRLDYLSKEFKNQSKQIEALKAMVKAQSENISKTNGGK